MRPARCIKRFPVPGGRKKKRSTIFLERTRKGTVLQTNIGTVSKKAYMGKVRWVGVGVGTSRKMAGWSAYGLFLRT